MSEANKQHLQRGAALAVGLIMLVLITLLVVSAMTMSTTGLKSVANSQFRDEAVAAGNQTIERMVSSNFTAAPQAQVFTVDIDNDGSNEYTVNVDRPVCLNGSRVAQAHIPPSSLRLGAAFNINVAPYFRTLWEIVARVTDDAGSGSAITVRQGVTVLVDQTVFNANCQGGTPP